MDHIAMRKALRTSLREISLTMQTACGIAKAADAWAQAGDIGKGVEIALEIEQLAYEARTNLEVVKSLKHVSQN